MKFKTSIFCAILLSFQWLPAETEVYEQGSLKESSKKLTDMELFNAAVQEMEHSSWKSALNDFSAIRTAHKESKVFDDALYFQAVCNYHLMEYDVANKLLTEYLGSKYKLKFFEDALSYKLAIANKFKEGAKKHLFDSEKFPKWLPAKEDALEIYDEIISTIPNHDLAAQALFEKGTLLQQLQDFKTSLESFHALIKRFSKHPLTPDSYLAIGEIYYIQSHSEYRNSDLLEMAQINLKKFISNFPRDEKVEKAKKFYNDMREIHAKGLYDIGMFYERIKKPKASVIYYVTALEKFPDSPSSNLCKDRLHNLEGERIDLQVSEKIFN